MTIMVVHRRFARFQVESLKTNWITWVPEFSRTCRKCAQVTQVSNGAMYEMTGRRAKEARRGEARRGEERKQK